MPRQSRIVVPGYPHHVTQRGNRRCDIFHSPDDYQRYLLWLRHYSEQVGVRVWAYCMMPNHVHLVVVPKEVDGLSRLFRTFHSHYAQHANARLQTGGHLWEQRYYSCVLDEEHLFSAVRYVERNPVRAGLAAQADSYAWSSARCHCGVGRDPVLGDDLPLLAMVPDWRQWLSTEDEASTADLRARAIRGMPAGDGQFLRHIETLTGIDPWKR